MKESKKCVALLTLALGLWLIAFALTFGLTKHPIGASDLICGLLLVALGLLSITPSRVWSGWLVALVGVWLQIAPLVFWAPEALMYLNDTLVGVIAIIFAFLLTKKKEATTQELLPKGWSYNPSSWSHRIPTALLAMLCWFFSRYMAAFQLGYIDSIWDPFFAGGTVQVITSTISKNFPVSDAGLGAVCYTLEAILGWQGSSRRFASMPWLVLAFAFLVIPVGIVSVTLIILQPVVVGAWCTWCLATAASMLLMIVLTAGELVAALQVLREAKQKGGSVWKVLWRGTQMHKSIPNNRPLSKPSWGFTLPWNLVASLALGIWLMFTPAVLGTRGELAMSYFILGPIVVAISVLAFAEVLRSVRYVNILCGLLLILGPWLVPHVCMKCCIATSWIVGFLILILALRRGKISGKYGTWNRFIL